MKMLVNWWNRFTAKVSDAVPMVALEELTTIEQCRRMYSELNTEVFSRYRLNEGQGLRVNTVYKSIDTFIVQVHKQIAIINLSGHVLPALCEFEPTNPSLNEFFLTADGYYQLQLAYTLRQFKTAVLELCACIDTAKHVEYDTKSYNLRLLTPLFDSLRDIGLTLHEVADQH